jgi:similar to stage IV sporulation protein
MPAYTLWSYLLGYVIIKIKGVRVEEFINRACSNGLYLWDIRKVKRGFLVAKMRADRFYLVRPLARRCDCKVEIDKKLGLPFLLKRLWRRKMFLMGTLIAVTLIYVLSTHIWFIQVEGVERLNPTRIEEVLRDCGAFPGALKAKVDLRGLERTLVKEIPGIAWAGGKIRGSILILQIVEKIFPEEDKDISKELIANKAGLIEKIIVFSGKALVTHGSAVDKGEVLIEGITDEKGTLIKPRGLIKGRIWYKARGVVELIQNYREDTGRYIRTYDIIFKEKSLKIGRKEVPFAEYDTIQEKRSLSLFGITFSITIIKTTYNEIKDREFRLTYEEARRIALRKAFEEITYNLSESFELVEMRVEYQSMHGEREVITAEVYIETLEDIGVYSNTEEGVISAR